MTVYKPLAVELRHKAYIGLDLFAVGELSGTAPFAGKERVHVGISCGRLLGAAAKGASDDEDQPGFVRVSPPAS